MINFTHSPTRFARMWMATLAGVIALSATGCQSTGSGDSSATAHAALTGRPVVVQDFAFDVAQLHTDPGFAPNHQGPARRMLGSLRPDEKPADKAAHLADLLSKTIVQEMVDQKIPASRARQGIPLPADGFVVGGEFLQADEGNRLQRAVVGFGAGASEVQVQVSVYDLATSRDQPILVFGTQSGSKPIPGSIISKNPYAMAARYVTTRNANEKDVRNLGKQIAMDLARIHHSGTNAINQPGQ